MEAWPRMVEDTPMAWEGNGYVRFVVNLSYSSMFTKTLDPGYFSVLQQQAENTPNFGPLEGFGLLNTPPTTVA